MGHLTSIQQNGERKEVLYDENVIGGLDNPSQLHQKGALLPPDFCQGESSFLFQMGAFLVGIILFG